MSALSNNSGFICKANEKKMFNGNMCVRFKYIFFFYFQKNSVKQITIVKAETVMTVGVETYIFTVICHFTLAIQVHV